MSGNVPATRYPGEVVTLGGRDFVVPAMSLGMLKRHRNLLENIESMQPFDALEGVVALVHDALCRNYPDITREEVEDLIDFDNAPMVLQVTARASKLVGKPIPEPTPAT